MDPHGIKVFNGTDNHHVVFEIPHDLQFVFLPAQKGFLHDDLCDHACIKTDLGKVFHLFPVVSHAAAYPPESKTSADNHGKAYLIRRFSCLLHIPCYETPGQSLADRRHGIAEKFAVLCFIYDRQRRPKHLHTQRIQQP